MFTIYVTFNDEHTVTRRTDNEYRYASKDERGNVRFHLTRQAAKRKAGAFGQFEPTDIRVKCSDCSKPMFVRCNTYFAELEYAAAGGPVFWCDSCADVRIAHAEARM